MNKPSYILYRCYNENGTLVYIGLSISVLNRLCQHKSYSEWFHQTDTIKLERFKDINTLRKAEKKAIEKEKPIFNIKHLSEITRKQTSVVGLHYLALHLGIPAGRIRAELQYNRFQLKPLGTNPYKWLIGNVEAQLKNKNIRQYINGLKKK